MKASNTGDISKIASPSDLQSRDCPGVNFAFAEGLFKTGDDIFRIRGVTYAKEPEEEDFERIAAMGANTVRTWASNEKSSLILDYAHKYGLKVLMGIWMRHGRSGPEGDDSFDWINDREGKLASLDSSLSAVQKYKDHPAMLGWGIGNEVTQNINTELEKIAYAEHLEKVCQAVKQLDSRCPLSSISAWTTDVPYWNKYCPSLDLYGINAYGYGAYALPSILEGLGVKKPYFLGEFGITGEWDSPADKNDVKIEPDDIQKYDFFAKNWHKIETTSGAMFRGGFHFHFGRKLSFTGIWLNFFIEDACRPAYWGTRKAFSGQDPINPLPLIRDFGLLKPEDSKEPNGWVEVSFDSSDCGDISFYFNQRTRETRTERDAVVPLLHREIKPHNLYEIQLPAKTGPIKVYAFLKDKNNNLAIASISLSINDNIAPL